jgi:hypothetical protein
VGADVADKLELAWPGKHDGFAILRDGGSGDPARVPYAAIQLRLLIEQECYGDLSGENVLIRGENLHALKTLLASGFASSVAKARRPALRNLAAPPPLRELTGHRFGA